MDAQFLYMKALWVCTEFREVILEAYEEEERRREEEERKKEERQALSRWYQLLSSMVIRERLNNAYVNNIGTETAAEPLKSANKSSCAATVNENECCVSHRDNVFGTTISDSHRTNMQNHEHVFLTDDESFDEDSMTRTKRCECGVSIQVEEL
ncbi:DNA repair protein RAD4 [Bienertia sinuspersici]